MVNILLFKKKEQLVKKDEFHVNFNFLLNKMKKVSKGIKGELDDHLDAINKNTEELQDNYSYICSVEKKVDKLNEKIDEMRMYFGLDKNKFEKIKIKPLTPKEKEVFLVLYEDDISTYETVSRKICVPSSVVRKCVNNMIDKGVPIVKVCSGFNEFLAINEDFKDIQAKKDILKINKIVPKKQIQLSLFNY